MNATTLILFLSALGAIQGVFFALLMAVKGGQRQPNLLLSLFTTFVSINLLTPVLQDWVGWKVVTVTYPIYFLIGPFLYLYVRSYTETIRPRTILLQAGWYLLFLAFTIYYVVGISEGRLIQNSLLSSFIVACKHLHLLAFFFLSLQGVKKKQEHLKMFYSDISERDQRWIKTIAYLYLLAVLIGALLNFFSQLVPLWSDVMAVFYYLLLTAAMFYLNGVAVLHPKQFALPEAMAQLASAPLSSELPLLVPITPQGEADKDMHHLHATRLGEAATHILHVIEQERLFLDPELTVNDLSKSVQLPPYLVSQAINTGLNKSFYDLINAYRVEEVKKLLNDAKHRQYKILSIAFQAGFNSKTVFNSVFK